jgi:hypothetical protein
LIQKQPGANSYSYTMNVNGNQQEFNLATDKEIRVGL